MCFILVWCTRSIIRIEHNNHSNGLELSDILCTLSFLSKVDPVDPQSEHPPAPDDVYDLAQSIDRRLIVAIRFHDRLWVHQCFLQRYNRSFSFITNAVRSLNEKSHSFIFKYKLNNFHTPGWEPPSLSTICRWKVSQILFVCNAAVPTVTTLASGSHCLLMYAIKRFTQGCCSLISFRVASTRSRLSANRVKGARGMDIAIHNASRGALSSLILRQFLERACLQNTDTIFLQKFTCIHRQMNKFHTCQKWNQQPCIRTAGKIFWIEPINALSKSQNTSVKFTRHVTMLRINSHRAMYVSIVLLEQSTYSTGKAWNGKYNSFNHRSICIIQNK